MADGETDDSNEEGGDGDLGLVDQAKREEARIASQAKKEKDKQETATSPTTFQNHQSFQILIDEC